MQWLEAAQKIRSVMDTAGAMLDDKQASSVPDLYPILHGNGALVEMGTRINWKGKIKRSRAALWDTADNNPDNAPDLWEDIAYKNGIRIIPDVITAEHPFKMDELGYWGDDLYKSKLETNVWTPAENPIGWEKQE